MTSFSFASLAIQATTADIQTAKKQCDKAQDGSFEALFAMFNTSETNDSNDSLSASSVSEVQGNSSVSGVFDILLSENSAAAGTNAIGFSSEFTDTFGNSGGPLFDWISRVTSALHLSTEQQAALQKIAIAHKDSTGSAGDVQAIRAELTAAGIA